MNKGKWTETLRVKVLAWFLLALCFLGVMGGAAGIFAAWELDVYSVSDVTALKRVQFSDLCASESYDIAHFALEGQEEYAESLAERKNAAFRLLDQEGKELWKSADFDACAESPFRFAFELRRAVRTDGSTDYYLYRADSPASISWDPPSVSVEEYETYRLEAAVDPALPLHDNYYWVGHGLDLLWAMRGWIYVLAGAALILGAVCFVFLLCGAGHRANREGLTPGYLTPVPFDLLTALTALCCFLLFSLIWLTSEIWNVVNEVLSVAVGTAVVLAAALLVTGWCTSLAVRIKLGKWWENTILFRLLRLALRLLRCIGRGLAAAFRAIPMAWRTLLVIAVLSVLELFFLVGLRSNVEELLAFWFLEKLAIIAAVLWIVLSLRKLQRGGAALAAGDFAYRTDTRNMLRDFRQHGENLNNIGLGMSRAVEERLKSERMKTELITNVSHDIKTPLTSIINYVDLLKTAESPEQRGEYLDVLDRQSKRLKKLTEDLIEVSKASTGNVEVRLSRYSVSELLRQAVGEYSERLTAAGLEPVLTLPEGEVFAAMDGRLMWRVLDNLFSNVCKYALSGTRFYIEAALVNDAVVMRFKNISRESLNLSAAELTERFVRGDLSRSGEGSGLGLSIARSLTELQGGRFFLSVDGDLFKVEVVFSRLA